MFWRASLHDLEAAQEGYLERIGAKAVRGARPPSAARIAEMMALYPDTQANG